MAPTTQAVYYRDASGNEPVNEFLEDLGDPAVQATLDLQIDRLNRLPERAPPLPFPHTSQIDGPLRELRCHYGNELFRVLYRRSATCSCSCTFFARTPAGSQTATSSSRSDVGMTSASG